MKATLSNDANISQYTHISMPGNITACGKQINGGLFDLKTHPLTGYGLMSFLHCPECSKVANGIFLKNFAENNK